MTAGLSAEQRQRFADQGYLVMPGLLDVETDIAPVKQSYIQYLDRLADIYMGETNPDLRADFAARPFAERFAILLGCSGGTVLPHLDPTLSIYRPGFRWRPDLPSAQIPALFWLMRNETLLDAVESLIGPEIDAPPNYHINLKLARRHLDLARTVARSSSQENPDRLQFWDFHVANTRWHMDAAYVLPNARDNSMVNAWIPLTDTPEESSCLLVVPGSHRNPILFDPIPDSEVANAVALPAVPGDVVFFHNRMLHGATANRTDRDYRWAFNFRYLPIGQTSGTVFLPSFVARSRALPERELRDPLLWSQMWRGGLEYAAINLMPLRPNHTFSQADADAVVAHWRAKISEPADWLRLGEVKQESLRTRASVAIAGRFTRRPPDPVDRLLIQKNWSLASMMQRLRRSPTARFVLGPLIPIVRHWRKMRAANVKPS